MSDDSLGQTRLSTLVLDRHERPRVAGRELASGNKMLDSNRKLQQTQSMGNVGPGLPERACKDGDCAVAPTPVTGAKSLKNVDRIVMLNRVRMSL